MEHSFEMCKNINFIRTQQQRKNYVSEKFTVSRSMFAMMTATAAQSANCETYFKAKDEIISTPSQLLLINVLFFFVRTKRKKKKNEVKDRTCEFILVSRHRVCLRVESIFFNVIYVIIFK